MGNVEKCVVKGSVVHRWDLDTDIAWRMYLFICLSVLQNVKIKLRWVYQAAESRSQLANLDVLQPRTVWLVRHSSHNVMRDPSGLCRLHRTRQLSLRPTLPTTTPVVDRGTQCFFYNGSSDFSSRGHRSLIYDLLFQLLKNFESSHLLSMNELSLFQSNNQRLLHCSNSSTTTLN